MKSKKKFGCVFVLICFAIIAIVLAFATNSKIQTSYVNSYLAKTFPESSVKKVKIGFGKILLEDLKLKLNEETLVSLKDAEVKFSLLPLLSKSVEISSFNVNALELELKEAKTEIQNVKEIPTSAGTDTLKQSAHSSGIAKTEDTDKSAKTDSKAELPNWSVSIALANLDTLVKLPDGSKIKTNIELKSFHSEHIAKVKSANLNLKTFLKMQDLGEDNLELKLVFVPEGGASSLKASLEKQGKKIVQISGKIDAAGEKFDTSTKIDIENSDLSKILKNAPTFKIDALLDAKFKLPISDVKLKLLAKSDISELQTFKAEIKTNPNLKFLLKYSEMFDFVNEASLSTEIASELSEKKLSIANAEILLSVNKSQILHLKNASAFKLDLDNLKDIPDGELLHIQIPSLPVDFINPFIKDKAKLEASALNGKFIFLKNKEKLFLETITPLSFQISKLYVSENTLLRNVAPSLYLTGSFDGKLSTLRTNLNLNPQKGDNLTLILEAQNSGAESSAKLSAAGSLLAFFANTKLDSDIILASSLDVFTDTKLLKITNANVNLSTKESKTLLSAKQLSDIVYDIKNSKLNLNGDILKLESKDAPFEIVKAFANGANAESFSINANISAKNESEISANGTVALKEFSFAKDKVYILKSLNPNAKFTFESKENFTDIFLNIPEFCLFESGASILLADAKVFAKKSETFAITKAELNAKGTISKLFKQPVLEKFDNASSGSITAALKLNLDDIKAAITLDNVSPVASSESAPKTEVLIDAKLKDFTPQNIALSLKSESDKGKTDTDVKINFSETITANIDVKILTTDDFEVLAKAFSNPLYKSGVVSAQTTETGKKRIIRPKEAAEIKEAELAPIATQPAPSTSAKDEKAIWNFGKNLDLTAKISAIQRAEKILAKNLSGKIFIDENKVDISDIKGLIYDANLNAKAQAIFTKEHTYELKNSEFSLTGLKVENFVQLNNAGEKTITGAYDLSAKFFGESSNANELASKIKGSAKITSKGGELRILDRGTNAGKSAEIGSTILKIGSGILGDKSKELSAISEITDLLTYTKYSSVNVEIERTEALDILVEDATLVSDLFVLKTKGIIKYDASMPLSEHLIFFPVKLYPKEGHISDLFGKINLLTAGDTIAGYKSGPVFTLDGRLSNPKNNLADVVKKGVMTDKQSSDTSSSSSETKKTIGDALNKLLKK